MSLQDVKFQSEGPLSYKAYAKDAAGLEFEGLWDEAQKLWGIARRVAKKPENVLWAQTRADYCLQAKCRNWRPGAMV